MQLLCSVWEQNLIIIINYFDYETVRDSFEELYLYVHFLLLYTSTPHLEAVTVFLLSFKQGHIYTYHVCKSCKCIWKISLACTCTINISYFKL